jgi:hypothetical protein
MRHKTGFFTRYATSRGRSVLMSVGEECYSYGNSQLCPAAVRQGGRGKPQPWRAVAAAVRQGRRGKPQPWRAVAAAVRQGRRGKPQPWRAVAAAVRQGGRGGATRRALHRLLWNSRASANGQSPGVHQSLHFAPACQLQRIAHHGRSLAEVQRVIADYLIWYNKRRSAFPTGRSKA